MLAVIVDSDTLRAIGLRHLLARRHDIESIITTDPRTIDNIDESTLFFVTPDAFASLPYYYVPRRERVVLLTDTTMSPLPVITPHATEEELRTRIDTVMSQLELKGQQVNLTERERQVLRLVALGHINKEISDVLGISFNTVLSHRKNITAKLGIKSVAALSVYAMMNGMVSESELHS